MGLIGQPRRRVEDLRLLTAAGCLVDAVMLPNALGLVVLRSPHPHARVRCVDVGPARLRPAGWVSWSAATRRTLPDETVLTGSLDDYVLPRATDLPETLCSPPEA